MHKKQSLLLLAVVWAFVYVVSMCYFAFTHTWWKTSMMSVIPPILQAQCAWMGGIS